MAACKRCRKTKTLVRGLGLRVSVGSEYLLVVLLVWLLTQQI